MITYHMTGKVISILIDIWMERYAIRVDGVEVIHMVGESYTKEMDRRYMKDHGMMESLNAISIGITLMMRMSKSIHQTVLTVIYMLW